MFIKNIAKTILNKIVYPHKYNNDAFCTFLRSKGAVIGNNTRFVAPKKTLIDEARLDYISIGDNCCFSHVTIMAHDYSWYILKEAYEKILPDPGGEVHIGNNVFVEYQAVILKGTTIGDNCIIGARAVVKGNIPSNTVWAGIPARQICTLDDYYNRRLDSEIKDAKYRRNHIRYKYNREPTIQEMAFFGFLFLERTEDNYNQYLYNLEFNGIKNDPSIKSLFFNTKPRFDSFEDFLKQE